MSHIFYHKLLCYSVGDIITIMFIETKTLHTEILNYHDNRFAFKYIMQLNNYNLIYYTISKCDKSLFWIFRYRLNSYNIVL